MGKINKKLKSGKVLCTVWENQFKDTVYNSYTFQKETFDTESKSVKYSSSFTAVDIKDIYILANKIASENIKEKKGG